MEYDILNCFSGEVQFTAEIDCAADADIGTKIGLAVLWAVKNGANLTTANLIDANLIDANLTRANLTGANLTGADLTGAKLDDVAIARTRILPDGDIVGWKKCNDGVLVKLLVPASAKRSHAFGRKCRAEYADVLEVIGAEVGTTSLHGPKTEYRVGTRVMPDAFDDNWMDECSNGIHFFITRTEAENY